VKCEVLSVKEKRGSLKSEIPFVPKKPNSRVAGAKEKPGAGDAGG
jgi:hypothetical protein